jgi:hypothetical protein
MVVE